MFQAFSGHYDAVNVLMNYIVNLDVLDDRGRTPLHLASSQGHTACCEALISQGATVMIHSAETKATAIHAAAQSGHAECLRVLLQHEDREVVDCIDEMERYE